MCNSCGCTNPNKLKDEPKECAPEQISQCHPESDKHLCVEKKEEPKQDN